MGFRFGRFGIRSCRDLDLTFFFFKFIGCCCYNSIFFGIFKRDRNDGIGLSRRRGFWRMESRYVRVLRSLEGKGLGFYS